MGLLKYLKVFQINIQSSLVYRLDFVMNLISGVVPLLVQFFIWTNIFKYNSYKSIMGYSLKSMIVYVIIAIAISKLIQSNAHNTIADEIKNGMLNQYLAKPLSHINYWISSEIGSRFLYSTFLYIVFCLLAFTFTGRSFNAAFMILGGIALILAFIINFLIYYILSLLSFWFIEVSQIFSAFGLISLFLSGGVLPIDFFPKQAQLILNAIPFHLIIYFPAKLFTVEMPVNEILKNISLQIFWVFLLGLAGKFCWMKGVKRYTAFGG